MSSLLELQWVANHAKSQRTIMHHAVLDVAGFGQLGFQSVDFGIHVGEDGGNVTFTHVGQRAAMPSPLAYTQFSTSKLGTRANSWVLLVTSVRGMLLAWAAMSMSIAPIDCPERSRCARMSP